MQRTSSDDLDEQDYDQEGGVGQAAFSSAAPSGDSYTSQPERDLIPGDPNLVGGAAPAKKQKMAEKVKGLFKKGHGHNDDDTVDAPVDSGVGRTPDSTPVGTAADNEYMDSSLDSGATDESAPHPTNPQGVTNEQGGAALTNKDGTLKPGPHTDSVKRETVFTKIKDKLHSSK